MDAKIKFSIVVPVFNAAVCLEELISRTIKAMEESKELFEIILVDDFSSDNSWQVIKAQKAKYPHLIKGVLLSKNFGQHNATFCGLRNASGEYCITMDDDLQHSPEYISKMINTISTSSSEVVYGVFKYKNHNFKRLTIRFLFKTLGFVRHFNSEFRELSSFRLVNYRLREKINQCQSSEINIDELIRWNTDEFIELELKHAESKKLKSGYNFSSLFQYSIASIINTSDLPLRILSKIGFSISIVSFFIACYYLIKKIFYDVTVQGYTSLIVAIMLSTGLIMYTLAFISLYLSKIYRNQNSKPSYSQKEFI